MKITQIEVNNKVSIDIKGDKYKLHNKFSKLSRSWHFDECIELENISLYYFQGKASKTYRSRN